MKKIALVAIVLFLLIRLGMWGYKQTQIESQATLDSTEPTITLKDKPNVAQSANKSSENREYFCSGDDFAVCEKYYLDSCSGEDYFSCFTLSTMYGEVLDFDNAKKYAQMVCENINANMPFTHTTIAQKAMDFSADDLGKLKKQACEGVEVYSALLALNASCDSGNGKSCHNLGAFYKDKEFGDMQRNKQIAITYFDKACNLDIAESCFNLGLLSASGEGGLQQDYKTALQYYEKACNLNLVNACTNLAMLYTEGRGVQQSRYHIAKYLCKSCNLGHLESCDRFAEVGLGLMLDDDCE